MSVASPTEPPGAPAPTPPAPTPPREGVPKRRTILLIVVIAVVVAILLAAVGVIFLLGTPPPTGPQLNSVQVSTPATRINQTETAVLTAKALDTGGVDQTRNVTWSWSATPAAGVKITLTLANFTVTVKGNQSGAVTVTAQATLGSSQKTGTVDMTVDPVQFNVGAVSPLAALGEPFDVTVIAVKPPADTRYSAYEGTVRFSSSDPNAVLPAEYAFSVADGGTRTFTLTLSTYGLQTLTVVDSEVPTVTGSTQVRGDRRPEAIFGTPSNVSDPADGRIVTFTAASEDPDNDPIASYDWEFGDGTSATVTTPSVAHVYRVTQPVSVNLTVADTWGLVSAKNSTRYHPLGPPSAIFVLGQRAEGLGVNVSVDASLSKDIDGGDIARYNWTWDDGTFSEVTVPNAFHVYDQTYVDTFVDVALRVTDDDVTFYGASVPHSNATTRRFRVTPVPQPPVAIFTWTLDDVNLIVMANASQTDDPNGDIVTLNWSWGDGEFDEGTWPDPAIISLSHTYSSESDFDITLTVTDATTPVPFTSQASQTVPVFYRPLPPEPRFSVAKTGLTVDVDASSTTDKNNDIASYEWDFDEDDIVDATGVKARHTYPSLGIYTIRLTVTDSQPTSVSTTKKVSVAASTLLYEFWDFFNVPYKDYWDYRGEKYGDLPMGVDCFNVTAQTDGYLGSWCAAEAGGHHGDLFDYYTSPPYTNWYPAPAPNIRPGHKDSNPFIYAPYRFSVSGASIPGYNVSEPVFLPVFNWGIRPDANSYVEFDWRFGYLTGEDKRYWEAACPGGWFVGFNDGFDTVSNVTLTMDLRTSAHLFGVDMADPEGWWASNTDNDCDVERPLETKWGQWFLDMGGTKLTLGKYDVVSGCEWWMEKWMVQVNGFVLDPTTGETRVILTFIGYCQEVLLSRWFYWGNASYLDNWDDSSKARGWWGMELAWFEDLSFTGNLTPANMNFSLTSVLQYHLQHQVLPGPDGILTDKSGDDIPVWSWRPFLVDYTNDYAPAHLISYLDRYPTETYLHSSPGSPVAKYGQCAPYDNPYVSWSPKAGEEWHFRFPTGKVRFYDPVTAAGADPTRGFTLDRTFKAYIKIDAPLTFDSQFPAGVGGWDTANMTWDVYGPQTFGPDGSPGNYARDRTDCDPGAAADRARPEVMFRYVASGAAGAPTLEPMAGLDSASQSWVSSVGLGVGTFVSVELQATVTMTRLRRDW